MARPVNSLSDADTRLAELNTKILGLEKERSALLAIELANAETRVTEIESFIGVYLASSPQGGAKAPATRTSAGTTKSTGKRRGRPPGSGKQKAAATEKPASTGKRRGRPPGSSNKTKAAATKPEAKPTTKDAPKKRARGNNADRLDAVKGLVKKAGKEGVSARRVAKDLGFPYVSVLNILNSPADFKKVGEKRDRRYFLK